MKAPRKPRVYENKADIKWEMSTSNPKDAASHRWTVRAGSQPAMNGPLFAAFLRSVADTIEGKSKQ